MKKTQIIIGIFLTFLISCNVNILSYARSMPQSKNSFAYSVSNEITEKNAKKKTSAQSVENPFLCRLFGKTTDVNFSFSAYNAEKVLICEDGRFFLRFSSEAQAEFCLLSLQKEESIKYVSTDFPIYADVLEEKESEHISWGPEKLNTDSFCDYYEGKEPTRTVVAVIDSGAADIDFLHGHLVQGYDFVDNDFDTSNDTHFNSHGTFLCGEIVDCVGMLPIEIMPIRVLSSYSGSLVNAINGIYYAVDNGANVINLSLGGKVEKCEAADEAIAYAIENNVNVVVCAGNERDNAEKYCPAHNLNAITVSAVDKSNNFASSFSNYGAVVDFSAPGVDIMSCNANGKLKTLSGTSMSTAFVSAAVAMIRSTNPELNPNQVFEYLKMISDDQGDAGWDCFYGWGTIDLSKASLIQKNWVTGVSLSKHDLILKIGEKQKIFFNLMPDNATNSEVIWNSSDTIVATVDDDGLIHALSSGKTEISVCTVDGKYTDRCELVVHPNAPNAISIAHLPNKTACRFGEELILDGLTVVAYYDGEIKETININELSISGFSSQKIGKQIINISYLGCEANFEVQVYRTWWQTIIWILSFQWLKGLF